MSWKQVEGEDGRKDKGLLNFEMGLVQLLYFLLWYIFGSEITIQQNPGDMAALLIDFVYTFVWR